MRTSSNYFGIFFHPSRSMSLQQVNVIATLGEYYNWREFLVVYSYNNYNTGALPLLSDSLTNMGCKIAYRLVILANEDRNTMREKLFELKDMHTRVFITHMTFMLGILLFS
jgi:hypothetical protein